MERNYENKKFFDFDAFTKLAAAIKGSESEYATEDLETLDSAMTSFRKYVDQVDMGEQQIRLAAVRFEGDAYREMISRYDRQRHDHHETAIANVRLVNRLASMYGVPPLFVGNDQNRYEVADYCLNVVCDLFNNRMM
jgi:hypothetical protein